VSYSFTVSSFNAAGTNVQMHLFLVPNSDDTTSPDESDPDVLAGLLLPQADGSAVWRVEVKTNGVPNCSGSCPWPVYGQITNSSLLGTWSLSFVNDTNMTLVAPDGSLLSFTLPPGLVARFDAPLALYFGVMAKDAPNLRRSVVLSQIQIAGNTVSTRQDDFSTGLDTNIWEIIAAYPPSIQPVPADAYWLNWTLPDFGFVLKTNSNLADPNGWGTDQLPTPVLSLGQLKYTLLTTNTAFTARPIAFPTNGSLFFRLHRPGS
jgi:hypothetical protein